MPEKVSTGAESVLEASSRHRQLRGFKVSRDFCDLLARRLPGGDRGAMWRVANCDTGREIPDRPH